MSQRILETGMDAQTVRLEHFLEVLDRIFHHSALHQEPSIRNTLLLASILRVKQTARSAQLLAAEDCAEDISSLSRTLVEVTVNAAYLQRAGYEELQGFIHFQPQAVYRQVAQLGDGRQQRGVLDKIKSLLLQPKPARFREHGDPTWSAKNLMERAASADATSNTPVMKLLMDRVYPRGHAALHGTMDSLEPFVEALDQSGRRPPPDRHAAKVDALFQVNLCLFTLCLYLNQTFDLRMDRALEDAARANHPLSSLRTGT